MSGFGPYGIMNRMVTPRAEQRQQGPYPTVQPAYGNLQQQPPAAFMPDSRAVQMFRAKQGMFSQIPSVVSDADRQMSGIMAQDAATGRTQMTNDAQMEMQQRGQDFQRELSGMEQMMEYYRQMEEMDAANRRARREEMWKEREMAFEREKEAGKDRRTFLPKFKEAANDLSTTGKQYNMATEALKNVEAMGPDQFGPIMGRLTKVLAQAGWNDRAWDLTNQLLQLSPQQFKMFVGQISNKEVDMAKLLAGDPTYNYQQLKRLLETFQKESLLGGQSAAYILDQVEPGYGTENYEKWFNRKPDEDQEVGQILGL